MIASRRSVPLAAALLFATLQACGERPGEDAMAAPERLEPSAAPPAAAAPAERSQLGAALRVVSTEPTMRYPKATWVVELELANRSAAPLWFLVPEPPEFSPEIERGAWAIEAARWPGPPEATMVRISATHGLLAFRLAPDTEVTVRELSLDSWHPEVLPTVEIWAVAEILLDGRPLLSDWLGEVDPTLSGSLEVSGAAEESVYEWVDPDLASHPLSYAALERWQLPTGQTEQNWAWRPRE